MVILVSQGVMPSSLSGWGTAIYYFDFVYTHLAFIKILKNYKIIIDPVITPIRSAIKSLRLQSPCNKYLSKSSFNTPSSIVLKLANITLSGLSKPINLSIILIIPVNSIQVMVCKYLSEGIEVNRYLSIL